MGLVHEDGRFAFGHVHEGGIIYDSPHYEFLAFDDRGSLVAWLARPD